jgi:pyruvate kinase
MMAKIVSETESNLRDSGSYEIHHGNRVRLSIAETICESAAHAAEDLDVSAIAVFTESGATARQLSKYRPKPPIYALSSIDSVIHRMGMLWGVHAIKCPKLLTAEQMVEYAETVLEQDGFVRPKEILGIVAGTRTRSGSTNFLRLHVLGDRLTDALAHRGEKDVRPRKAVRKPGAKRPTAKVS